MIVIEANLGAPQDARALIHREAGEMVVSVPGDFEVTVGTLVLLRATLSGMPAGMFLEGVVQGRVLRGSIPPRATPFPSRVNGASVQVRLLPSQRARAEYLWEWAHLRTEGTSRTEWRIPWERKVLFSNAKKGASGRMLHGTVRDVSRRGALVTMTTSIPVGSVMAFGFLDPAVSRNSYTVRIVWNASDHIGLENAPQTADEGERWGLLVQQAEQELLSLTLKSR